MFDPALHPPLNALLREYHLDFANGGGAFATRFMASAAAIRELYGQLYDGHPQGGELFTRLLQTVTRAHAARPEAMRRQDAAKQARNGWFLDNDLVGMSLYVDRFAGDLQGMAERLPYLKALGVNLLHLMPLFQSPAGESDGGYAVSDFRTVDTRFGTLADLQALQQKMAAEGMHLMLDIVLNHTSHHHEWARKARQGDAGHQAYYYFHPDRTLPDQFDRTLPDIFPESAPGNFTYVPECGQWAMTVFHTYQWDLNYTNPAVFVEMLDTILFYANLGVDVLRIDAPAFVWKQLGTTCQNLPQAHTLLRLIRQCVQVAAPGMALLGEAIVAPRDIIPYFGTGTYTARECDLAYNATQMALQWDALATTDTRVMHAAQPDLLQKPAGTSWITYTRCHDDIGLGFDDAAIAQAGYDPYRHRRFLKDYYSGAYPGSPATGALFSVNPKTQDARISGTLASLCGLEKALVDADETQVDLSIRKILLMQACSFFVGGLPMLFSGDELGYTNDYAYLTDPGKNYDNRWMHRPRMDWPRNERRHVPGTVENRVFADMQRLIALRRRLPVLADRRNVAWLQPHNRHVAGYVRTDSDRRLFCVFNFSPRPAPLTWYAFREMGLAGGRLYDHWQGQDHTLGRDDEFLVLEPYGFCVLEPVPTAVVS